jgi:hypothetical protein
LVDVGKTKVVELKIQLDERGLSTKGNKKVLVQRLADAIHAENTRRAEGGATAASI